MVKFIHTADWHLDSPFAGLDARAAAARRRELRDVPERLAQYVKENDIALVLLAGDLFDSAALYRDTAETLAASLGKMRARVLIAPGNHDCYGPAWENILWPDNVYIFRQNRMTSLTMGDVVFHGAAFTAPEQSAGLLEGFSVPEDGKVHIGLLHGEIIRGESRYNPISPETIAASGLDYLALGHIHKRMEPARYGRTLAAFPGCIEGRGFDETGDKGFYQGTIGEDGTIEVEFIPFAKRRYESIRVDVTEKTPKEAIEAALSAETQHDIYRITLTGETGEGGIHAAALEESFAQRFYALEVRDETRMARDVWDRCGEDTLRGLFLRRLKERFDDAQTETEQREITAAARFGLAALDRRDLG